MMESRLNQAERRVVSRIVAPIAALVGGLILVVIVMVILLARQQTADAVERQRELAHGAIDVRLAELSNMTDDYAHWDEALEKLGLQPDREWADENIGATMNKRYGVDMVFVIDGAGRTSYAMMDQASSTRSADTVITTGYREILEQQRRQGPDAVASGLVIANGLPALVVVAPLRPFIGTVDTTRQARNVLVFIDRLDEAQLRHLSDIYRLPALRLAAAGEREQPASIGLQTIDGKTDVYLAWEGDDPGARLLRRMLPVLGGLLSAFAVMTVFVLRNAYKTARELRIAEDKASRDPMSGLWNRAMLTNDLDRRFSNGVVHPFALFYLDLDGFKLVNDTHGHDVGDAVIRATSLRIVKALPKDAKAYRLGGDEFAVVMLGDALEARLASTADAFIAGVSAPIVHDGLTLQVGVTIGIARAPQDAMSATKLARAADQALYAGKRAGKGMARFAAPLRRGGAENTRNPHLDVRAFLKAS